MLLSKSGPTDICPHPLRAVRPYDRTLKPATRGAKCSATPTGAAPEMLRQISSAVKLHGAKPGLGSRPCSRQVEHAIRFRNHCQERLQSDSTSRFGLAILA